MVQNNIWCWVTTCQKHMCIFTLNPLQNEKDKKGKKYLLNLLSLNESRVSPLLLKCLNGDNISRSCPYKLRNLCWFIHCHVRFINLVHGYDYFDLRIIGDYL